MKNIFLKRSELAVLIKATLNNASELIEEADILFEKKRFARTYSLSQFSLEELAKAKLFADAFEAKTRDYYKERLEVAFGMAYSHLNKLATTSLIDFEVEMFKLKIGENLPKRMELFNTFIEESDKASDYNKFKNDSLYVDIQNGNVIEPSKEINLNLAKERLMKAKKLNAWCQLEYMNVITRIE